MKIEIQIGRESDGFNGKGGWYRSIEKSYYKNFVSIPHKELKVWKYWNSRQPTQEWECKDIFPIRKRPSTPATPQIATGWSSCAIINSFKGK